jgi:uncharacterized protein (TIGR02147 family)
VKKAKAQAAVPDQSTRAVPPDLYRHNNYKSFLREWVAYRKRTERGFSLRRLEADAGFAVGYLSGILTGAREISLKALLKLIPLLKLTTEGEAYFENLVRLSIGDSQDTRLGALERMSASKNYQKQNPNEARLIQYFSRWHHVAIRELASIPGFKTDPKWIQSQLKVHVSLPQIREALHFLGESGLLKLNTDGTATVQERSLECLGSIFKSALTQYHRQMFELAAQSIDNTPGTERNLEGATISIDTDQFETVRNILQEAMTRIRTLSEASAHRAPRVFHVELAVFPMSESAKGKTKEEP